MIGRRHASLPAVLLGCAIAASACDTYAMGNDTLPCVDSDEPIVIAHRGASGYVPEHTLAAYALAIEMGADYIEPDLVITKDGVLVARHENLIDETTDVAERTEFADRRATKVIDGVSVTGWFTEDFTLAELKTLRARERLPALRTANVRFDGMFEVPTLDEVLQLVRGTNFRFRKEALVAGNPTRRCIGVYPETKHPSYFDALGLSMEEPLVETLKRNGFTGPQHRVYIQSFEVGNLKDLNGMTKLPLVQLLSDGGQPWDFVVSGDPRTYADLATPAGLAEIATYADGIGANKNLMIRRDSAGNLATPTTLIADAHALGLIVHGWTFRAENFFLPTNLRSDADPRNLGDLPAEIDAFLQQGMDGFFTDHPDIGVAARDAFVD